MAMYDFPETLCRHYVRVLPPTDLFLKYYHLLLLEFKLSETGAVLLYVLKKLIERPFEPQAEFPAYY
jgi:hypothetical protein